MPFDHRMWVGGTMKWDPNNPLIIGEAVSANSNVTSIVPRGFEGDKSKLFLTQTIEYSMKAKSTPSLYEERTHVYIPKTLPAKTARPGLSDNA